MATSDQYQLDIDSVRTLIQTWHQGSKEVGWISEQLANIHNQLTGSIPSALVEGLLGEVPLAECFSTLAAAVAAAKSVAQGLAEDAWTLDANLTAYASVEAAIEAKLKAVQEAKAAQAAKAAKAAQAAHGAKPGSGGTSSSGSHSSGGGSSSGGGGVQPPGPASYANQAQVESWINQAFQALEAAGVPASELNEAGVLLIIEHESSGNPNAINNWDSNAKAGDPSRGLMQVIGTTFDEYKLSGHDDIYNPVDNIIAGVRYAISRYGSIQNVPGVKSVDSGGKYVGY